MPNLVVTLLIIALVAAVLGGGAPWYGDAGAYVQVG
jgi:hypothetical protein